MYIVYGHRDIMVSEYGACSSNPGKYLVMAIGDERYHTEGYRTLKEAKIEAEAQMLALSADRIVKAKIV